MDRRRALVLTSGVQLASGLVAMAVAIGRRRPCDVPLLHGKPSAVGRDSLYLGTALSAPVPMLVAQALAAVRLARRPSAGAERTLGALGAAMVPGYLAEHLVRARLRRGGGDIVESPLIVVGLTLAGAMVWLSRRP